HARRVADLQRELDAARERILALEPFPVRFDALRAEAVEREKKRELSEAELERDWSERHAAALEQKESELEAERRRVDEHARRIADLQRELDAARERVLALEPYSVRFDAVREELGERERKHDARAAELERAWSERHAGALQAKDTELEQERRTLHEH